VFFCNLALQFPMFSLTAGIGKSRAAADYVRYAAANYSVSVSRLAIQVHVNFVCHFQAAVWIDASSLSTITADFLQLGRDLRLRTISQVKETGLLLFLISFCFI
jgi:hypothetical protein